MGVVLWVGLQAGRWAGGSGVSGGGGSHPRACPRALAWPVIGAHVCCSSKAPSRCRGVLVREPASRAAPALQLRAKQRCHRSHQESVSAWCALLDVRRRERATTSSQVLHCSWASCSDWPMAASSSDQRSGLGRLMNGDHGRRQRGLLVQTLPLCRYRPLSLVAIAASPTSTARSRPAGLPSTKHLPALLAPAPPGSPAAW